MHPASCANTHHDVTNLLNHGMTKNTKSWEWTRAFLQNEKVLNLCV